ncbi:ParA family protein [Photobacterium damselae]|uniref:ParA family protein n=1 Tax=Photobacterium damselae TaxID=38293 RepID=UPI001F391132|nr:ParA family protein [Photobacterium damselae]UKA12946.1 ParA family protein [Photobacterium damselae subsp. damselae]
MNTDKPMRIAAVWNPKGGQGKTTLSVNLAACASKLGLKVILISKDIQDDEGMTAYGDGDYKFTVMQGIPHERPDADLIIIDHPAGDRNPPEANIVVVPVVPCKLDYRTYMNAKHILEDGTKTIIEVVSKVDVRVREQKLFAVEMRKQGASHVKQRSCFSDAFNNDVTIFEKAWTTKPRIVESRTEIDALLARILAA